MSDSAAWVRQELTASINKLLEANEGLARRVTELEDAQGASIRVGEWIERSDGLWALRIPRS